MTREEARQRIKILSAGLRDEDSVEYAVFDDKEALEMAISALSAEPCDDCISRQAVLNAIQKLNIPEDMCVFEIISHIEVAIATLPSVENKYFDSVIEDIKAELTKDYVDDNPDNFRYTTVMLKDVLAIIDKHISGKEK